MELSGRHYNMIYADGFRPELLRDTPLSRRSRVNSGELIMANCELAAAMKQAATAMQAFASSIAKMQTNARLSDT